MKQRVLLPVLFAIGLLNLVAGHIAASQTNSITSLGPTMPPPCPTDGCLY